MDGVYMHDPLALAAVLEPTLFDWREGAVRVLTDGIARGASLMDAGAKNWNGRQRLDGSPQSEGRDRRREHGSIEIDVGSDDGMTSPRS